MYDLEAMEGLTAAADPPECRAHPAAGASAHFAFGDASGPGFGVSFWTQGSQTLHFDFGTWESSATDESSNFQEFLNFIEKLEALHAAGKLHSGAEFFFFTDNTYTESAFYNGSAKSEVLFYLVLHLHYLQLRANIFVHVIWISGKHMIAQGTESLSRGDLTNGVMHGANMLQYIPLHLSVLDR